jgi:thiol:disulfide interchange protein
MGFYLEVLPVAVRTLALLALLGAGTVQAKQWGAPAPVGLPEGVAEYSLRYDPARDPEADFTVALAAAKLKQRRVLVIVGGDWCVWCFLLDRHFAMDAEATGVFYGSFEVLRVYYNDDNKNQRFLARFPEFNLFPHFFVVESDGRVAASVPADVFIGEAKYQTALIRRFAEEWD